jgi:transcriptional regulator with XRE-family HTH domain
MPTLPWMAELGDQIRMAREGKGWSQQELGDKIDLSRVSISSYENGKGNPDFRLVAEIASALGMPFTVLGCTIGPEDVLRRPDPAEQLCLEFDQNHSFLAKLTIRPSQKSITITAEADFKDKLA